MNNKKPANYLILLLATFTVLSIPNLHSMDFKSIKNPDEIFVKDLTSKKIKRYINPIAFTKIAKFVCLSYLVRSFTNSHNTMNTMIYSLAIPLILLAWYHLETTLKEEQNLETLKEIVEKLGTEIPLAKIENIEKKCLICLENENTIEKRLYLNFCGHFYHIDCLKQWLESDNENASKCTYCKKPLVKFIKSEPEEAENKNELEQPD